jgi:hypothetical protein
VALDKNSSIETQNENTNTRSQRPQRKAATKEAILNHLNRDVEPLEEKKNERKSVGKRQLSAHPNGNNNTLSNPTGSAVNGSK